MPDDLDLLDDDVDGEADTGSGDDSAEGRDAPPAEGSDDAGPEDKRVNDLMGKWQREQAKSKRLEAELAAVKSKPSTVADVPPNVQAWMDAAKDGARERYYAADPRFADYGLDQSAIDGSTPDEMKASKKRWSDLFDAMETKVRASVLADHGIVPEISSTRKGPSKDFGAMSAEDFEKEVARVTGGSY